jgi:hypothetical protein
MVAVLAIAASSPAAPVWADIEARFVDAAPKDRFTIRNADICATGPIRITVDLTDTAGGLYFDTTVRGAGVSVYQPFELAGGAEHVAAVTPVADGARGFTIEIIDLPPGAVVTVTTDVDDALPQSAMGPTRVDGGEILGGRVSVALDADTPPLSRAEFDAWGGATVPLSVCLS